MALQSALTIDQLNAIRAYDGYHALQFVCLVPNTVVVQFHPDAAPTTAVYAEIAVDSPVLSGDMADIRQGMTVIFSTTSDFQATETFRTRVRKVSGTTTLYVGENSAALTASDFVTVIDAYEVQEKMRNSVTLVDWDIAFRLLLPIETDLPSAVVLTNGETEYSPVGAPIWMDASASAIDTHAWESSNANDTLDSGGTTNNPTFTLEAGSFRNIRYTFTDSNGNSNFRVIPVWTVPRNYSSVVALGFIGQSGDVADIRHEDLGWTATVPAWDGIEDVLNRTMCVIASDEWYNDTRQSIRTNINFVGYLQNEGTNTQGDEQHGKLSETRFTVESFGHQLARQNISPITIIQTNAAPAAWDAIQDPTPGRMLTYRLTEYSTILNLVSLSLPSDDLDFIGDDLTLANGKALDDMRTIAETINAELQWDLDGRLDFCRNLNFRDTAARDAAPVVATMTLADFLAFNYDYDYSRQTSQVTLKGGDYETTLDRYDLTEAIAPAEARYIEGDPYTNSNQVLLTDSTQAEANAELGQRAANFLAYNNPTYAAQVVFKDEWWFLVPDVGSWVKFDIPGADTARGKVFTSADRWQLVQTSFSTNALTGRRQKEGLFRHETASTGAMVRAHPIIHSTDADLLIVPAVMAPFVGENLDYTNGNWYDSQDPAPPGDPTPAPIDCELGGFRVRDVAGYTTANVVAGNGELIQATIRGSGIISEGGGGYGDVYDHSFSAGLGDWTIESVSGTPNGVLSGGRLESVDIGTRCDLRILLDFASPVTVDKARIIGERVDGSATGNLDTQRIECRVTPNVPVTTPPTGAIILAGGFLPNGTFDTTGDPVLPITNISQIQIWLTCKDNGPTSKVFLDRVIITFLDAVAPDAVLGDAFYYSDDGGETWQAYDPGEGLLIEGLQPDAIPPHNPEGEYVVFQEVTSGVISYEFNSPFALSEAENFSFSIQTCLTGIFP